MVKFKKQTIREFTHELAKNLYECGDFVLYKGKDPYRYISINPIKIKSGVITDEEAKQRQRKASNEGQEVLLSAVDALKGI